MTDPVGERWSLTDYRHEGSGSIELGAQINLTTIMILKHIFHNNSTSYVRVLKKHIYLAVIGVDPPVRHINPGKIKIIFNVYY